MWDKMWSQKRGDMVPTLYLWTLMPGNSNYTESVDSSLNWEIMFLLFAI